MKINHEINVPTGKIMIVEGAHGQRRIDAIRARNVATLAALEQQRLKGF